MTYGTKKDSHHVVPGGLHVERDIGNSVIPLHMHVVVLTNKVNAKYILLLLLPLLQQLYIEYI